MFETVIAGIVILLISVVLTMQNVRIAKKANKELVEERHLHSLVELANGVKKFDKIDKQLEKLTNEQVEQGKVLIKVYTIVNRIEKNGNSSIK